MYEVIYIKADYEPWWMFDGWRDRIVSIDTFEMKNDAETYLQHLLSNFRTKYTNENRKNDYFYAFWSNDETAFCDYCDEDLQIYHGLFLLFNGDKINE